MKFKLYYKQEESKLDLLIIKDDYDDVFLSKRLDQPIQFPVINKLEKNVYKYLMKYIKVEDLSVFKTNNTEAKNIEIYNLRKKYNPIIFDALKQFRIDNAEYFIWNTNILNH